MTDRISTDEVTKVAKLASLRLSADELELFTEQLGDVLEHAADLQSIDLSGVEPMARPVPLTNVLRTDDVGPALDRGEVLGSAPATEAGQFRVPPVMGESR